MNDGIDLHGIFPPLPTPFSSTGALDLHALAQHLAFLEAFELRGVVTLGSNGEAVHLDPDERAQMIREVRRLAPRRLLIAGTGCASTAQTIRLTLHAADAGADVALVLPPHYYRGQMTADVLTQFFHSVAEASPIPILLYNMPACTGIDLDAATIIAVAEHANVIGLKDSAGDLVKLGLLRHTLGDRFQILAGSAGFLLPALSVGSVGGILAVANIAPAQCISVYRHAIEGSYAMARAAQLSLIEVNDAVTRRWGVAGLKAAMRFLSMDGGSVRPPLQELDGSQREALHTILIKHPWLLEDSRRSTHQ
jgi:4-hydroxy-2-oxoglutarate aldolase